MFKLNLLVIVGFIVLATHAKIRLPTPEDGCGKLSTSKTRIVGGTAAKNGQYPWMVIYGYDQPDGSFLFNCDGTIMTPRHTLTAAHCIFDGLSFARVGEFDQTTTEDGAHQDIPVKSYAKHEAYDEKLIKHDIAVVLLTQSIPFGNRIQPICLPFSGMDGNALVGQQVIAAGWGNTVGGTYSLSKVLKHLQIPVVSPSLCQEFYPKNRFTGKEQVCAGDSWQGHSVCQGDSGGPLMLLTNKGVYQVGVVSYVASGCDARNAANVYTSTSGYIEWIKAAIDALV